MPKVNVAYKLLSIDIADVKKLSHIIFALLLYFVIYNNIHWCTSSWLAGLILEIYGYLIFAVLSSNDAYYVVWMIDDLIKDIY